MRSKLLTSAAEKTFAIVFEIGDEALSGLLSFAKNNGISAAHFTGIGAFSNAVLGYFDWEKKQYRHIPVNEQVEVLSLIGDVALEKGEPKVHAHVVAGKSGGATCGGHLLEGHVRPTLEIVLSEAPAHLQREFDPQSGIALIRL